MPVKDFCFPFFPQHWISLLFWKVAFLLIINCCIIFWSPGLCSDEQITICWVSLQCRIYIHGEKVQRRQNIWLSDCKLGFHSKQFGKKKVCPIFFCKLNTELYFHFRAADSAMLDYPLKLYWCSITAKSVDTLVILWSFCFGYLAHSTLLLKNISKMTRILPVNKATCCFRISKRFPSCSWDLMTIQKGFGKALAGLQLSCLCCWTKTPYSSCCQVINNS